MDQQLLFLINHTWAHPALDRLMAVMSSLDFWWPFLIALGLVAAIRGGFRMRMMLLTVGLAIAMTDAVAVRTLKDFVGRPRPHEMLEGVRTLDLALARPRFLALAMPLKEEYSVARIRPPRGSSFPSAHAANNFRDGCSLRDFLSTMGLVDVSACGSGCLQPRLRRFALAAGRGRFVPAGCRRGLVGGCRCRGILASLGRTLRSPFARETSKSADGVSGLKTLLLLALVATAARMTGVWFTDPVAAGSVLLSLLAKTRSRLFRWSGWHGVCHGPRERRWKIGHRLAIDCAILGALRDIRLFRLGPAVRGFDARGLDRVVVECRSGIQFCRSACGTRASGPDVCPVGHARGMACFRGEERQRRLVDRGGPVFWCSLVVCLCRGGHPDGCRCRGHFRAQTPPSR